MRLIAHTYYFLVFRTPSKAVLTTFISKISSLHRNILISEYPRPHKVGSKPLVPRCGYLSSELIASCHFAPRCCYTDVYSVYVSSIFKKLPVSIASNMFICRTEVLRIVLEKGGYPR